MHFAHHIKLKYKTLCNDHLCVYTSTLNFHLIKVCSNEKCNLNIPTLPVPRHVCTNVILSHSYKKKCIHAHHNLEYIFACLRSQQIILEQKRKQFTNFKVRLLENVPKGTTPFNESKWYNVGTVIWHSHTLFTQKCFIDL